MRPNDQAALLTVKEAASILSVSVSTLYGWVWQRKISFVKVGRALRFHGADLEKFIRSNRYEAKTREGATFGPPVA